MTRYKLPTSHELFQTSTIAELVQEQFEDLYEEKRELEARLPEADGKEHTAITRRLQEINEALEGQSAISEDELADYWEAEAAAGREPDLTMTVEDLRRLKGRT